MTNKDNNIGNIPSVSERNKMFKYRRLQSFICLFYILGLTFLRCFIVVIHPNSSPFLEKADTILIWTFTLCSTIIGGYMYSAHSYDKDNPLH